MKVVVTGASGLLGSDVSDVFEDAGHHVIRLMGRKSVNILNTSEIIAFMEKEKPDLIVHCAGYRDLDDMELHEEEGYALNAFGAKNAALAASKLDCKLIYISTDAVYDGEKETGYHEYDAPDPVNVYGKSKLMAELEIRTLCKRYFIVRTALLFGYKGHRENNLIFSVIDNLKAGQEVYASTSQVCCPSYTKDLAEALLKMSQTEYYGTYLAANTGAASRYDVNRTVAEIAGLDVSGVRPTDESRARPAKRARYTVFKPIAFPSTFQITMADWRDALERCIAEMLKAEALKQERKTVDD